MSAPLIKIPLKDIELITNNFADANFIGEGFLGKIYEGQLSLPAGESIDVAVRRLDNSLRLQEILFEKEISILTRLKHENMVSVVGFCYENDEMLIVSKRVARGSLSRHLCDPRLTWIRRLQISVGAVRALSYLHSFSIIHHNINTDSILIDEDWEAKISGFEYSMTIPTGSLDRAYEKFRIGSCKSDMFSIGVVLFQLLCRKEALFSEDNKKSFQASTAIFHYENRTLNTLVDPDLFSQMDPVSFNIFSKIAYNCLIDQRDPPTMDQVLQRLERALKFQQMHENNGQYSTVAIERTIPDHLKLKLKSLEHMRIRLDDILTATENFAAKYGIVSGGFGLVYKSELDHVDKAYCFAIERENEREVPKKRSTVAIKRIIDTEDEMAEQGFYAEIEILTSCKHSNILTLLGFCDEGGKLILIYEYASNRSLSDYLQKTSNIRIDSWAQRVKICLDVAKGLSYIHTTDGDRQEIVHRDIKSSNILLDENFEAKVGDFGLSVFLSDSKDTHYSRTSVGTPGYVDPQYWEDAKLKKESDVYSFGVVLFEILCGTLAYDRKYNNNKGLAHVARQHFNNGSIMEMVDPKIKEEIARILFTSDKASSQESLDTFSKIAYKCLAEKQVGRPTMEVVVKKLQKALFLKGRMDHLKVPLSVIKFATNRFSERYLIGYNGYESDDRVYIAELNFLYGSRVVAIKRILNRDEQTKQKFSVEIEILSKCMHENIVSLVGFCDEEDEMISVYEYASKGSLDDYLGKGDKMKLTWVQRIKICLDIAYGLDYLHTSTQGKQTVIHGNMKSENILLDDNCVAKISGFGFIQLQHPNQQGSTIETNVIAGTPFYIDPEYEITGKLQKKSDIYSFGVVLFEILSGRLAYDEAFNEMGLAAVARQCYKDGTLQKLVDPKIKEADENNFILNGGVNQDSLDKFSEIAYKCVALTQKDRPRIEDVIPVLEEALRYQEDYEEWELKLPTDYKNIIQLSKSPHKYDSIKMKKDLYDMFSKGILLKDGKVLFSLGSNGERNEMISARKFSFKNCRSHKWRSLQESRFQKVAEVFFVPNLNIKINIRTRYLSSGVNYGVHLVFKFCGARTSSTKHVYVNLTYKMGNEIFHAYFATWRDDDWMRIELYRFLKNNEDKEFEFLLESFSQCYCGNRAVYIEGVEFRAIDNVKYEEFKKIKTAQVLKSELNIDQVQPLPIWISKQEIEFGRVHVISMKCKIEGQMLSPDTNYACYFVFKLSEQCQGLHCPIRVRDALHWRNKEIRILYFRPPNPCNLHDNDGVPAKREDGSMEVIVWKFNSTSYCGHNYIPLNLKLITYEGTMSGLIQYGSYIRPM